MVLILAAGAVALAAIALSGRATRVREAQPAPALSVTERTAIARALGYPYPLRCLTIAVFADDADYATAKIDRGSSCARYRGEIYGSLHRVDGTWRLVLDEGRLYIPSGPRLSASKGAR